MQHLQIGPDAQLNWSGGDDGRPAGIGQILLQKHPVRSGRRPMFVDITNPWGIHLRDWRCLDQAKVGDRLVLTLAPAAEAFGRMEWMLHAVRARRNTTDWTLPPRPLDDTRLELRLAPVERWIGDTHFSGFSYQYAYTSASIPIYMLLDRATWELGGAAPGNEIWMRNGVVSSIYQIPSADVHYSTEWYLPSTTNPNVFQFHPLQTQLQGFTFTAAEAGVLVTWATRPVHLRTLLEKPRGSSEIVHWHEHCGDLTHTFETAEMEVLFAPGARDRVARANLHEDVRRHVSRALHEAAGLREDRVTSYGVIEEWSNADLVAYREKGVRRLADAGIKTLFLCNHFENNMNAYGVGNMCCTTDLQVPDSVGEDNLRQLTAAAQRHGMRVEMWGNTALSTLALILRSRNGRPQRIDFAPLAGSGIETLQKAADPFVRNPSNAIEADHYTPVFACLNLRDQTVRDWWRQRWRWARESLGLDGIFLDSSFNLSSDKFHWIANTRPHHHAQSPGDRDGLLGTVRPAQEPPAAILSQYLAHLELVAQMQRDGYFYCAEDTGVFGIHRSGPSIRLRLAALPLWSNSLCVYDRDEIAALGADADDVFFRGLAYGMMWFMYWVPGTDELSWRQDGLRGPQDRPTAAQLKLLGIFDRVAPRQQERTILPDERAVVYRTDDGLVLWALDDAPWPDLDGRATLQGVADLVLGETYDQRPVRMAARHVYLIQAVRQARTPYAVRTARSSASA